MKINDTRTTTQHKGIEVGDIIILPNSNCYLVIHGSFTDYEYAIIELSTLQVVEADDSLGLLFNEFEKMVGKVLEIVPSEKVSITLS